MYLNDILPGMLTSYCLNNIVTIHFNSCAKTSKLLLEEIKKKRRDEMKKNLDMARELLKSEDVDFYTRSVMDEFSSKFCPSIVGDNSNLKNELASMRYFTTLPLISCYIPYYL